jgi:hypothetical protein
MTDWEGMFREHQSKQRESDRRSYVDRLVRDGGHTREYAEASYSKVIAGSRGFRDWVPDAIARVRLLEEGSVVRARPPAVRSSAASKHPFEKFPEPKDAWLNDLGVDYGLSVGTGQEDPLEISVADLYPPNGHGYPEVVASVAIHVPDMIPIVEPTLQRLRGEAEAAVLAVSSEVACLSVKKAAELKKAREHAKSPEAEAKKNEAAREGARKSFAAMLHHSRDHLPDVAAEELQALLHLATEKKHLLKALSKWAGTHPRGYAALTLDDIVESLDNARVQGVLES